MSGPCPSRLGRLPLRGLLVGTAALMAFCARPPADGAAWRTGFVLSALAMAALVGMAWQRGGYTRGAVLGLALVLRLLAFPLPPALSDDGYRYVWDGMLQVQHGVSPYRYTPDDPALQPLHGEPLYPRLNSPGYHSIYPPLSQLVFAAGGLVYPLGWRVSWYLIKLLFALAEGVGLWLLSRMVEPRALVLYAWNPLVVMEAAGQGHADALVVPLLLLALRALQARRGVPAGVALAGAGWVKLLPFVLAPFALRRGGAWRVVLAMVVAMAVASAVVIAPYAAAYVLPNGRSSLALYVRLFEFNAGPYYALKEAFRLFTGDDWSKRLGPALLAVYLAGLPVLYLAVWRRRLPLAPAFALALGLFLACATTVHPWYLLPLLALIPLLMKGQAGRRFAFAWLWLAAGSMATYWRYAGPAWGYTAGVTVGWVGWAAFTAAALWARGLPALLRARAKRKWRWVQSSLPPLRSGMRLLDLGAGEGYVGSAAHEACGVEVTLADVVDFNRTAHPHVAYDGRRLPFEDGEFDLTVLVFVLHHAENPEQVLVEAGRVTRGPVVVVESVYRGPLQRGLLEELDRFANRLRSGGLMRGQEAHLHFRTDQEWRAAFAALGFRVTAGSRRGLFVHEQRLYCLEPLLQ